MAKKKKEEGGGGAPEWMVTYGDMVTLLLTFFVLLLTFMEPKEEDLVQQLMQALREEFGYEGGARQIPSDDTEAIKNVPLQQILQIPIHPEDLSPTDEDGPRGQQNTVTNIRNREYFAKGGRVMFPELSAEMPAEERARLAEYAEKLRGHTTMIEIRGHSSKRPVDGSGFSDHYSLSYARARAVLEVLLEAGIDERRTLIMAAGTSRPVTRRAYNMHERERNDLVELLQRDRTFSEFAEEEVNE